MSHDYDALPDDLAKPAKKLLAAARRQHRRGGAPEPTETQVMQLAVMTLCAEVVERDEFAPLKGICRAIAAISIQHGQAVPVISSAVLSVLSEAWAEHEAEQAAINARTP